MNNSDEIKILADQCKLGNRESFDELLQLLKPAIFNIIKKYRIPSLDVDDLYQEACIGLYEACMNYDESRGDFFAFSIMLIKRHLINVLKSALRQKHIILNSAYSLDGYIDRDTELVLIDVIPSVVPTPEKIYLSKEKKEEYMRLMEYVMFNCSLKEKGILKDFLYGCTYEEISHRRGVTVKSVDNALYRIRTRLKKNKNAIMEELIS